MKSQGFFSCIASIGKSRHKCEVYEYLNTWLNCYFLWTIYLIDNNVIYADIEMMISWCHTLVVRIEGLLYVSQKPHHGNGVIFCIIGKAREKLKWADGKAVKAEIDMQVRYWKWINKQIINYYQKHV